MSRRVRWSETLVEWLAMNTAPRRPRVAPEVPSDNLVAADPRQPRSPRPRRRRRWLWILVAVVVMFLALSVVGAIVGPPPTSAPSSAPSSTTRAISYALVRTIPAHMPSGNGAPPNIAWLQATRNGQLRSCDFESKAINLWDLRTGRLVGDQQPCDPDTDPDPSASGNSITSPDGRTRATFNMDLSSGVQESLTIYAEPGDRQITSFDPGGDIVDIGTHIHGEFSPDGALFATKARTSAGNDSLKVWDARAWSVAGTVDIGSGSQLFYDWTWGTDSHTLAVARDDGTIRVFRVSY